jgi:hypothetical protein
MTAPNLDKAEAGVWRGWLFLWCETLHTQCAFFWIRGGSVGSRHPPLGVRAQFMSNRSAFEMTHHLDGASMRLRTFVAPWLIFSLWSQASRTIGIRLIPLKSANPRATGRVRGHAKWCCWEAGSPAHHRGRGSGTSLATLLRVLALAARGTRRGRRCHREVSVTP